MKRLIAVLLAVMLLAGCAQKPKEAEPPVPEPTKPPVEQKIEDEIPESPPAEEETNLFDARKIKAGDVIAGMKVVKVEVHNASDEDYDAYVDFEGEVTISGSFKHNKDDEFLDHEISFTVDEESMSLLPTLAHDQRNAWFMFMNHDEAEKAFGPPGTEGKAAVTINNYSIKYAHTEVWNTAEFVKADIK